jgi:hypothetical protein
MRIVRAVQKRSVTSRGGASLCIVSWSQTTTYTLGALFVSRIRHRLGPVGFAFGSPPSRAAFEYPWNTFKSWLVKWCENMLSRQKLLIVAAALAAASCGGARSVADVQTPPGDKLATVTLAVTGMT